MFKILFGLVLFISLVVVLLTVQVSVDLLPSPQPGGYIQMTTTQAPLVFDGGGFPGIVIVALLFFVTVLAIRNWKT